jgi:transcriptional regulator with XRE-family HTH domain
MGPKQPDLIDRVVGQRLRTLRQAAGMSQGALGQASGITFQQIQKYEKGTNRISVGRLVHLAKALGTTTAVLLAEPFKETLAAKEARPTSRRKLA